MNNAGGPPGNAPVPPILPAPPVISTVTGIQLRPPLANVANRPLVVADLVGARAWRSTVDNLRMKGEISDSSTAMALADAYITKLECLYEAPPVISLADVMAAIGELGTRLTNLTTVVTNMSRKVGQYGRLAALTYNASCGNGNVRRFAVVPNAAGDDPTEQQIPLPHLQCLDDIAALSHVNTIGYCHFYGVDPNGLPASITRGLAAAIGVVPA